MNTRLLICLFLTAYSISKVACATTYYVDSAKGSNSFDGKTRLQRGKALMRLIPGLSPPVIKFFSAKDNRSLIAAPSRSRGQESPSILLAAVHCPNSRTLAATRGAA